MVNPRQVHGTLIAKMFRISRFSKIGVSLNHPFMDGFSIINYPFWVPPFMETTVTHQAGKNTSLNSPAWCLD